MNIDSCNSKLSESQQASQAEPKPLGGEVSGTRILAWNVSSTYLALAVQMAVGLVMLPFNVAHLGQSEYGLWVLMASVTSYFSIFDLGFGMGQVKFAAQYRAQGDSKALNEVVSTLFFLFSLIGLVVLTIAAIIAFNLESLFNIASDQATTGRSVLMVVALYVAMGFPFSVFGGVVNGFQRQYLNSIVAIVTTIVVALINVAILQAGYGLVELVSATTGIRMLSYLFYRKNAYRAFPELRVRLNNLRLLRLREVTSFSLFLLVIDAANKLNYSSDAIIIGAFIGTVAVSIWSVAQRLIETTQTLTTQLNGALFPVVVDVATLGQSERLRRLLIQGTRLSLAMVLPIAAGLIMLGDLLVLSWLGPAFDASRPIIYILAVAVTIRVGTSTATTLLKGSGEHKFLAGANLTSAVANVVLSIFVVRRFGLIGVAFGTLIPLALVSAFVLFPAACRRAQLTITDAVLHAIWPALWPVVPMIGVLLLSRHLLGGGLLLIAIQSAIAGSVYAAIFFGLAIGNEEKAWYQSKLKQLIRRPSPAAA